MLKNSIIYLSSSILSKSVPFLLLPIMTSYLSPEEYGYLSIYLMAISLIYAFVGMNMHVNISKIFFKVDKEELATIIGNIFFILFITTLFYTICIFSSSLFLNDFFSIPIEFFLIIPILNLFMMINELNTTILRNEERAYMFGIFEVSNTVFQMGFTILFLIFFMYGWYSQISGMIVSGLVFFIIGLIYMKKRKYISLIIKIDKIKSILSISVPMIPHILATLILGLSDRLFIEKMVSMEAVGLYSVGYMFGMVIALFTDAFMKAWSPWFYKNLTEPTDSKKEKIVKYTYMYILGTFILAIIISILSKFIFPFFVDEKFYGAEEFILWIAIGYAIQGIYKIFFPYLVHISKTYFLSVSTVIAALLNLVFNYFFIKEYGTIGAAYATILSFAVSSFMVFWFQNKYYKMPWSLK
jgi:O-antigen/teichoic acid export membrane protein